MVQASRHLESCNHSSPLVHAKKFATHLAASKNSPTEAPPPSYLLEGFRFCKSIYKHAQGQSMGNADRWLSMMLESKDGVTRNDNENITCI